MDIGIAEVRKSEKKNIGGPRAALRGPNLALGAEGHPKSIQIDTSDPYLHGAYFSDLMLGCAKQPSSK